MKLNDLTTWLDETLDLAWEHEQFDTAMLEIYDSSRGSESMESGKWTLNVKGSDQVIVTQNKTAVFDSLISKKQFKNKLSFSGVSILSKLRWSDYLNDNNNSYWKYHFLIKLVGTLFALAIILWIDKLLVTSYLESGYKRLLKIKQDSGNIAQMQQNLNDARFDFIMADILYYPFRIIPHKQVWNGHHIIKGWKNLTELWDDMFALYSGISELAVEKGIGNISYINLLKNIAPEFRSTEAKLQKATYHYDRVQDLSDEYVAYKLDQANAILKNISSFNSSLNQNYSGLLKLLWSHWERKYLVVFQNADEIRPTGWFMWSMWIVTIENGKLKNFDKRDVYNYEWNLKTADYEKIPAPKGIDKLTEFLWLRDANYLVNLESSSKNIKFFMNQAGFDIDGVVYLNQNVIIDMLKKTGWVELDYLDREINWNNFSVLMSTIVEAKLTKKWTLGTPKQVLFDFIDSYIEKITDEKLYPDAANVLVDNLLRREIGIYSFREDENTLLSDLNLGFNIDYSSTLDFSYPVYTSIWWNKSDRYMKREYSKDIVINDNCSIDTNLEIILKHLMTKNRVDEVKDILNTYDIPNKANLLSIQWDSPNKSFIRVLLPKQAIIQDNNLISIIEHPSSKEVNFFITTRRLETRGFNLYYSLPNTECRDYDFKFYNQPGIPDHSIIISDPNNSAQKSWVNTDFYYSID